MYEKNPIETDSSIRSTTYMTNQGFTPTLPGSESAQENQPAHGAAPVTGQQPSKGKTPINRSCDTPIIGGHGKPSRAARRAANKLARKVSEVAELARAASPASFCGGEENRSAHGAAPVTGLQRGESRKTEQHALRSEKGIIGTGVLAVGRPSEYTPEEADVLCAWVVAGGSLRAYSQNTGRSVATVYRWMRENAGFQARYAQAHEDRADTLTDEMLDIADGSAKDATIEDVAAAKLRVETRKWIASKLRPQKWGDKQVVEHVGAVSIRIGIAPRADRSSPLETVERVERLA